MKMWLVLCVAVVMGLVAREAPAAEEVAQRWVSTHTKAAPDVDGRKDKAWDSAEPLVVVVREAMGGANPREVVLRALHTDDRLYVLAEWPDSTPGDMRDPYLWNAEKKAYERPTTPDDQFGLEFALEGELQISMIPTKGEYVADVWHWKAGRSNLGGWVDDKRHLITQSPVEGALEYSMGGHNTVYIRRPMDAGTHAYKKIDGPKSYAGDRVGSFVAQEPSGSQSDIRGKGVHSGSGWTLEMTRKFETGNSDDAVIVRGADNLCMIAILDDELYWEHSTSQKILLDVSATK